MKNEFFRNPIATVAAVLSSIVALASLIIVLWYVPTWVKGIDKDVAQLAVNQAEHCANQAPHIPYVALQREFDKAVEEIKEDIREVKSAQIRTELKTDSILAKVTNLR